MDTPTPTTPPAPAVPPAPPTPAAAGAPRSAQVALGLLLAFTLGLLAFRGYGNWFGARPTETRSAALTDLNRADRAELEQVPGIGPALAKQIDDHRRAKGPFKAVGELRQVKGFGPATFDKVRPFLRVEPQATQPQEPPSLEPLVLERRPAPPPAPAPYPRSGQRKLQPGDPPVDVNAAGVEQLMTIPGVGPVTAQNILAARAAGPFKAVEDLDRVKGIGPKTLEKLRPFVVVK
jgi:competence protein ComEA